MVRIIVLFFIISMFAVFLSATGLYRFDFQIEKMTLFILLISSAFIGFLIGNLISYRSSREI